MTANVSMDIIQARENLAAPGDKTVEAVIGFDGFVDEIIEVVDKRTSPDSFTKVETIAALGERISKAAGLSTNIELVPRVVKLGGNGPIMANALSSLGLGITYIGALGKPTIHPVFAELAKKARVVSIAEPGHTDALEFSDGKVMLGKQYTVKDVNWKNLLAAISVQELVQLFSQTSLIATVNWTMLPYMTELWQHLLDEVIAAIEYEVRPIIFFDLADPEKRSKSEIVECLETIRHFNASCRSILGLNRKEATQVAEALELHLSTDASETPLDEITRALAKKLGIYGLVIHPTAQAACVIDGCFSLVDGPYTSRPRLTTGAGDNFNAGFCLGQVLDLSPQDSLILGTGTSGFYVRNGHSPDRADLLNFLELWAQRAGSDF